MKKQEKNNRNKGVSSVRKEKAKNMKRRTGIFVAKKTAKDIPFHKNVHVS